MSRLVGNSKSHTDTHSTLFLKRHPQQRYLNTRADLLRSAAQTFAERGFAACRIEDVAHGAGRTRGAFYDHFLDKEDLFLSIYEDLFASDTDGALFSVSKRSQKMLLLELWLYVLRVPSPHQRLRNIHAALTQRGVVPSDILAMSAFELGVAHI